MAWLSIPVFFATAALAIGCAGSDGAPSATVTGGAERDGSMQTGEGAMRSDVATESETSNRAMDASNKSDGMASRRRARQGKRLKVVGSSYGRLIADGRGEAFYLFDRDRSKKSQCYGECARAWPPVITKGRPRAGKGIKNRLLGTTRRNNGKLQVTYKNHPLYYYVDDAPGQILCQNVDEFGGLWLVVKPSGNPVR